MSCKPEPGPRKLRPFTWRLVSSYSEEPSLVLKSKNSGSWKWHTHLASGQQDLKPKVEAQCWASNFLLSVHPPNSVHWLNQQHCNWISHISRDIMCEGRPWMTGTSQEAPAHGGCFSRWVQKMCFSIMPSLLYYERIPNTWVHGAWVEGYHIYSHTITTFGWVSQHLYSSRPQTNRWPY